MRIVGLTLTTVGLMLVCAHVLDVSAGPLLIHVPWLWLGIWSERSGAGLDPWLLFWPPRFHRAFLMVASQGGST